MRMRRVTVAVLLPVLLPLLPCAALSAQQGPAAVVTTIDGRVFKGAVTIDAAGAVDIAADEPTRLVLEEVASVKFPDVTGKPMTAPHRVWMRSGLEFAATDLAGVPAADGKPHRLAVELPMGVTLELPLSTLHAVRRGGSGRQQPASFSTDLREPADNTDMVWVQKDGQQHRFQVTVNGLRPDMIDFDLRGNQHEYAFDGLVAIVFGNNTGFAVDRAKAPRVAIDFDSGDHLEGKLLGLGTELRLRLDEGCEVTVSSSRMTQMNVESDRLRWLSDLVPQVEQTPAFDRVWPWTKDRSLAGPGLVLNGKTHGRGIGMVPRTRLTYDLGGDYDEFLALIGIDDRGGPQAHAVFRVLVDGKVAYESQPRTRGMPAEAVRVALNKCQRLAIEVDFGKNYDLGDYCVFANARVLRK